MTIETTWRKELAAAITDKDFELLELKLREPNIFRALRVERKEIQHSSFLAYLLDPNETHGLEDLVLRKFLRDIFNDQKVEGKTLLDADLIDLRTIEVRREWRNIDLLIVLPEDVIVIENKVDSSDHSDQLERYRRIATEEFNDRAKHFVYLTPSGEYPRSIAAQDKYINYSYESISKILETLLSLHATSIGEKIRHYLVDYLITLKREILMTDELNHTARKLYIAHKAAFDFIIEHRPARIDREIQRFEILLQSSGFLISPSSKGYVRFTTPGLDNNLPKIGTKWKDKELFLFELDINSDRVTFKAIISPSENEPLRASLLTLGMTYPGSKPPTGKQFLTFFLQPFKLRGEIADLEDGDLEAEVADIVQKIAPHAKKIASLIELNIPNLLNPTDFDGKPMS